MPRKRSRVRKRRPYLSRKSRRVAAQFRELSRAQLALVCAALLGLAVLFWLSPWWGAWAWVRFVAAASCLVAMLIGLLLIADGWAWRR